MLPRNDAQVNLCYHGMTLPLNSKIGPFACSKSEIKTLGKYVEHVPCSGVFLLTYFTLFLSVSIVEYEQVNVCWGVITKK